MKVLLDMDTGVDDSIALLYALNKPEMEIVGISTIHGNVEAWLAAENTHKVMDLVHAPEIPVVRGVESPTVGSWHGRVAFVHGDNGLGNVDLPQSKRTFRDQDVSDFHMELAEKYEGELVLITLGPLTNIARTLEKYPEFAKKIKRVVMMGGTVAATGNVSPVVEANFSGDPEACDKVFQSGMDITVVGLDVTTKTRLKKQHIEWLTQNCKESAKDAVQYMQQALSHYMNGNKEQNYCMDDCPLHDPLAMMCALKPHLVTTETRKARIECGGTYCRGMVVTDLREHPFDAQYVHFAMQVRAEEAIRELMSAFWEEV